ncbi:MAG: hypothetical protein JNL97_06965 [Verrucomicrobiales bacterium]|nr:hypothetical protein [Verrucomicrobiales bacterium]
MVVFVPAVAVAFSLASRLLRWIPAAVVVVSVGQAQAHAGSSGGWLGGGATGEYFANAELSGTPAFVRRDVRVDFDWRTDVRPGGSPAPDFGPWAPTRIPLGGQANWLRAKADRTCCAWTPTTARG